MSLSNPLMLNSVMYFADGSAAPSCGGAWAVVRVQSVDGNLSIQYASGKISHADSLIAEFMAAQQAICWADEENVTLVVDNRNVLAVLSAKKINQAGHQQKRPYWRWLLKLMSTKLFRESRGTSIAVKWVKGHTPLSSLPPNPSYNDLLAWGNHLADRLAASTLKGGNPTIPGELHMMRYLQ